MAFKFVSFRTEIGFKIGINEYKWWRKWKFSPMIRAMEKLIMIAISECLSYPSYSKTVIVIKPFGGIFLLFHRIIIFWFSWGLIKWSSTIIPNYGLQLWILAGWVLLLLPRICPESGLLIVSIKSDIPERVFILIKKIENQKIKWNFWNQFNWQQQWILLMDKL